MAQPTRRVSVVVPTRDRRELLLRALASALSQEDVEVAVVVVDEASSDGTREAVAQLADARVSVVAHDVPRGVAAARNAGVERIETEWVAFLDDDDVWAPDKLAAQLAAVDAVPGAGWSFTAAVVVDESLRVVGAEPAPPPESLPERLLEYNAIPGGGSSVLARTETVRDAGGFDPELSVVADWDLWIRLALRSPAAIVERPLVAYSRHSASMSANVDVRVELEHVLAKHRRSREEHGVPFAWDRWLGWRALMLRRAGRRWAPARAYAALSRGHRPRLLAKAAFAALWPQWLELREGRALAELDPDWLAAAERWLAPLRSDGGRLLARSVPEADELEPAGPRGLDDAR